MTEQTYPYFIKSEQCFVTEDSIVFDIAIFNNVLSEELKNAWINRSQKFYLVSNLITVLQDIKIFKEYILKISEYPLQVKAMQDIFIFHNKITDENQLQSLEDFVQGCLKVSNNNWKKVAINFLVNSQSTLTQLPTTYTVYYKGKKPSSVTKGGVSQRITRSNLLKAWPFILKVLHTEDHKEKFNFTLKSKIVATQGYYSSQNTYDLTYEPSAKRFNIGCQSVTLEEMRYIGNLFEMDFMFQREI